LRNKNMSQEESVDIIDENENFVKVVPKKEAHEKGLLHKTVISQLIDSKGRWFLTKPSEGRQDAGQYVAPVGGHVSAGETEIETLKRENKEEIGLAGDFKYEFVGKKVFNRFVISRQENHFFVMYKSYSDMKPVLSHEAESGRYFTEAELKKELKENSKLFGDAFHFVAKAFFPHLYL